MKGLLRSDLTQWETGKRRCNNMKVLKILFAALLSVVLVRGSALAATVDEINQGDKVIIVMSGSGARLCAYPRCEQGKNIALIPEGTVLEVEGITNIKTNTVLTAEWGLVIYVTERWFEVTYEGKRGWIDRFDAEKVR
jgi:hypothetical protein